MSRTRWSVIVLAAGLGGLVSACAGGGSATVNCGVAPDGLVSDCLVVSQTPRDSGHGAAAVQLSNGQRLSAETMRTPPARGGSTSRSCSRMAAQRPSSPGPALDLRGLKAYTRRTFEADRSDGPP